MVDVDSEVLFDAAAAFVTTVAIGVFVVNVDWPHSPVSKLLLVLAVLAGVFAVSQHTGDATTRLLGYAVVLVSTLVVFFDVVGAFGLGDAVATVGLFVLAIVLYGLRTHLDESSRFVSGRTATLAFGALAALAAVVLVVDVVTGAVAVELQVAPQVQFQADGETATAAGTVVVSNPTPLPEEVHTPRIGACAAGNWSAYQRVVDGESRPVDMHASVRHSYGDVVWGGGERSYPVRLHVGARNVAGESFPVQRTASCPDDEDGQPYVALYEIESPPGVTAD